VQERKCIDVSTAPSVPFAKLRFPRTPLNMTRVEGFFRGPEGPLFHQEFTPCKVRNKSHATLDTRRGAECEGAICPSHAGRESWFVSGPGLQTGR
jgi:hypothetical protein